MKRCSMAKDELIELKHINEIVKIDNRLITRSFADFSKKWTAFDLDWWTILTSQVVDHKDNTVRFSVDQVKTLLARNKNTHESLKTFIKRSNLSLSKFLDIKFTFEQEKGNNDLALFTTHMFDSSYIDTDLNVILKISPTAAPVFNQLKSWTRFAIGNLTALHTSYSKRLFIYLKQWRTVGKVSFKLEDFREKLDVPKSYKPGSIDQKILDPAMEDLAPYFMQLRVEKTYVKAKRGHKLSGYIFTFKPNSKTQKDIYSDESDRFAEIYSIVSNRYLSFEHKLRAIDRYRGLRLGTTRKYYESAHPQTVFLDDQRKDSKLRYSTRMLAKQSITSLKRFASAYENLLVTGWLKEWDLEDLFVIEKQLFLKQVDLILETKENEDPYKPSDGLIASQVIKSLKDIENYDNHNIDGEIHKLIQKGYGRAVQQEDHRSYELRKLSEKLKSL